MYYILKSYLDIKKGLHDKLKGFLKIYIWTLPIDMNLKSVKNLEIEGSKLEFGYKDKIHLIHWTCS